MAKTYYTVLTTYGSQLFAQAMANRQPVRITQFAVGDGNGRAVQPDSARTSLVRQVHRANISAVSPDPRNNRQVIFELTIPENVGGFWIREMGIYDANNRLVAYANCPDTYKPQLSEGSGKVQVMRMILLVSSSQAVTLTVDDTVIFATRGQLTPKTITATSQNGIDDTGHSHTIDHATTGQKGIVQLTNDTGLDSEALALTAKAGKKLAQEIAKNHQLASSKYTAQDASTSQKGLVQLVDNLTSSNNDKALTAKQGKTLNEKIKYIYNIVKSGSILVNMDLTSREQIIAEMGNNYQGIGVYRFTFHNLVNHNITGLPLGDIKGAVAIELEVMGGFSRMSCQYLYANRLFFTHVDWNKPTLTLRWCEVLSQDGEGKVPRPITVNGAIDTNHRVMVRRNSRTASPYLILLDDSVDLDGEVAVRKLIGGIQFHAGKQGTTEGLLKGALRVNILTDKNAEIELASRDANETWVRFLTMLTATGNVIVGHGADNGRDRLQIKGTVKATAPAANANNDQIPTTAWVNSALDKLVNSDGYVKRGGNKHNIELSWQPDGLNLKVDVTNLGALVLSSSMVGQVAFFASSTPPSGWLKANGAAVSRTTYAALFARVGTRFGAGDGRTTFNLPDLRGEFVRGWDDGRNIDAGRGLGSLQLGSAQVLNSSNAMRSLGIGNQDNQHADIWQRSQHDKIVAGQQGYQEIYGSYNDIFSWHGRNGHGRVKNGNNQIEFGATRPRNIALLACIKY